MRRGNVADPYLELSPAGVWKALTDPELHAKWWAAGDVSAVVGHRFTLDMGNWGQRPCVVLAAEPGRILCCSFDPDSLGVTITWRLQPEGTGTRLALEHSGFDVDSPLGKAAYNGMSAGWPQILARIESALRS